MGGFPYISSHYSPSKLEISLADSKELLIVFSTGMLKEALQRSYEKYWQSTGMADNVCGFETTGCLGITILFIPSSEYKSPFFFIWVFYWKNSRTTGACTWDYKFPL